MFNIASWSVQIVSVRRIIVIPVTSSENLSCANNKDTDQTVNLCSLINAFVVRCLDIPVVAASKIPDSCWLLQLVFKSLTWLPNSEGSFSRHDKTCPRGFRPSKTQTSLHSHRS